MGKHMRLILGGLIVLAVCVLVWFVAPLIVVREARPLESVWTRLWIVVALVMLWLMGEGLGWLIRRRRNRKMIEALGQDNEDDSLTRLETEVLDTRFTDALKTLKSTRLGGRSGAQLLYQLPWYMFIGAPGSGKTTALVNSGLRFPLADGDAPASALGGIGGTRNCDWWFTEDAVLIDTAGRYTTQDSNTVVDQSAWKTFLNLLKRFRPRQPINGVLVTLSVGDLLSFSPGERQRYAQTIRMRLEELQRELSLQFPVYVLVTKCDLIAGFSELFSTFDAEQRAQVWGVTFELDLRTKATVRPKEGFDQEFPRLVAKLNDILLARLQQEPDPDRRAGMYPFPQEFAAIGPLVTEFLDKAFSDSKYLGNTLVRGVYFTSGTQEGAPIDRLVSSLSQSLEVRTAPARRPITAFGSAKSYFISRLITQVIFPEAGLAGHNEKRERRSERQSLALICVAAILGLGLIAGWTTSFIANREGLRRAEAAADLSRTALAQIGSPVAGDLPALVMALDTMGRVPREVNDPVPDPPWAMTWGLYQGDKVDRRTAERYRNALQNGLMPRIALQLESIMAAPQSRPEAVYAALKAYSMMYEAKRLDRGYFLATMADLWSSYGFPRDVVQGAVAHLESLMTSRDLQVARFHPANQALVAQAREKAGNLSMVDRAYSLLRLTSAPGTRQWRVSEVVGPRGMSVLARASGVSLAEPVAHIFTREGYRTLIKPRIKKLVSELAEEEEWVLGGRASGVGKGNSRELETAVLARFLSDYRATWEGLLRDIRVVAPDSVKTALSIAQVLAQSDSPLKRLVVAVAEETRLTAQDAASPALKAAEQNMKERAANALAGATSGIFGSQAQAVVAGALPGDDPVRAQELALEAHFASLRQLAGDGKTGEIDAAVAMINEIFNELVGIQQKLSGPGLKEMPAAISRAKAQADRFPMPVSGAIKTLTDYAEQLASGGVQKEMSSGIAGAASLCAKALPRRYPFQRTSMDDAGVQDFVNVFKAGGDLDAWFNSNLAAYVDKSGGVWRLKSSDAAAPQVSPGALRQFQNADAIRAAFLNGGAAPSVVVDVAVVSGDADVTLEYDGTTHKLGVGSGSVRLAWPAKPGARLALGGRPVASADGAWALFRLVDKGAMDPTATGDKVRASYAGPAGRAVLEIRAGSAANNPFRLRELENFSCPGR